MTDTTCMPDMTLNLYGPLTVVLLPFCCAFFWWFMDPADFKDPEERAATCFGAGLTVACLWFMIPFIWPAPVMVLWGRRSQARKSAPAEPAEREAHAEATGIVKIAAPTRVETVVISENPTEGAYR